VAFQPEQGVLGEVVGGLGVGDAAVMNARRRVRSCRYASSVPGAAGGEGVLRGAVIAPDEWV
jgi:hypothetical protein